MAVYETKILLKLENWKTERYDGRGMASLYFTRRIADGAYDLSRYEANFNALKRDILFFEKHG